MKNVPHEQHTDLLDAADSSSSYLLMEDRISVEEISGGNSREALCRRLNSSSNRLTASFTHSETPVSSVILLFSAIGRKGWFTDEETGCSSGFLRFRTLGGKG
jgi:hypothetical protein